MKVSKLQVSITKEEMIQFVAQKMNMNVSNLSIDSVFEMNDVIVVNLNADNQDRIEQVCNDIPEGYTYDSFGNILTYKDSEGYWCEYTRDSEGEVLTFKNSDGYWYEYTHDSFGKILTYKDSEGYWEEYTRDSEGNELTFKDSDGFWYEYTRDSDGNVLMYKDSNGKNEVYSY